MGWVTGIVLYILVWWVTLFAILPLWITPSGPDDVGGPAGAPQNPMLARKLALTTVVAAVVWFAIYIVVNEPWLSLRGA